MSTVTFKLSAPAIGAASDNTLGTVVYDTRRHCARLHPAIRAPQLHLEVEKAIKECLREEKRRAVLDGNVPATQGAYIEREGD